MNRLLRQTAAGGSDRIVDERAWVRRCEALRHRGVQVEYSIPKDPSPHLDGNGSRIHSTSFFMLSGLWPVGRVELVDHRLETRYGSGLLFRVCRRWPGAPGTTLARSFGHLVVVDQDLGRGL